MIWLGIDPGLDGAVAAIIDGTIHLWDSPALQVGTKREPDASGMACLVRDYCSAGPEHVCAAIESVHSMPEQGVASSFAFGKGFGIWLGILATLRISHELVTPQRWKKAMLDGMPKDKDASRQKALQLFPQAAGDLRLKKHHGRADALLIAEYRRRTATPRSPLSPPSAGQNEFPTPTIAFLGGP